MTLINETVKTVRAVSAVWIKQVPDLLFMDLRLTFSGVSSFCSCEFSLPASRMTDRTHKCVLPEPEINPDF